MKSARIVHAVFLGVFLAIAAGPLAAAPWGLPALSEKSKACVDCHKKEDSGLYQQWGNSKHFGANVGCFECHAAEEGDKDAFLHEGALIATIVSPKDCARCHEREAKELAESHHAKAGQIIGSVDNQLAEIVEGNSAFVSPAFPDGNSAAAVSGCWQCHGSEIKVLEKGKLDPATWPNTGIGRINPDGTEGSCSACHSRHTFSVELARHPDNCGKCHMGPDHPQIEIYNESKHGIAFYANRERMALDREGDWILGRDYSAAPTCATCHMSGFVGPDGTVAGNDHDVGERISWTLRPIVSTKLNLVVFQDGFKEDYPEPRALPKVGDVVKTAEKYVSEGKLATREVERRVARVRAWEDRRAEMKQVCASCHATTHVNNFYDQYDSLVTLYNDKFAKPAKSLMDRLEADGVLNPRSPFGTELGWVFYELWHHEGRRARHGASMMGPDYTHWHGMYEVAKHFYTHFLPGVVEAAAHHSPVMGEKYRSAVDDMLARDEHLWLKGLSPEETEELKAAYQRRYQQKQ